MSSQDQREPSQPTTDPELVATVYRALEDTARRLLHKNPGHTLQTADLVHEGLVRVLQTGRTSWDGPGHLYGYATKAIRSFFLDYEERRKTDKRGGGVRPTSLEVVFDDPRTPESSFTASFLTVEEALTRLGREHGDELARLAAARVFFRGSVAENAQRFGVSESRVKTAWRLFRRLLEE